MSSTQQSETQHGNGQLPIVPRSLPGTGGLPPAAAEKLEHAQRLLAVAEERSAVRTRWPAKLRRFPFSWMPALERFFLRVLAYVFKDQRDVNSVLIGAARELAEALRAEWAAREEFASTMDRLSARLVQADGAAVQASVAAGGLADLVGGHQRIVNEMVDALSREFLVLERRNADTDEAAAGIRNDMNAVKARLEDAVDWTTTATQSVRADFDALRQHVDEACAVTAALREGEEAFREKTERLTAHPSDEFQVALADRFRGSEADVRQRLSVYLPFLEAAGVGSKPRSVLDIGFGRGEWLELLRDNGYGAFGVDANRLLVERAEARGYDVIGGDACVALRELADQSLRCISAFHVVEHLPFDDLIALLDESSRLLQPGGVLIVETPNPENVVVGTVGFYLDPTHFRPYPMALLRFMLEHRGFSSVETLPLNPNTSARRSDSTEGICHFNDFFYGAMDYGVIARRP